MHSQAKLIQHLNAVRSFLVSRHAEVQSGDELSEGCICYGSEHAAPDGEHDPLHTAVKQLVMAEFDKLGKAHGDNVYMYPVRIGKYESDSNYYGTADAAHQGYCDRIALIDRWIAAAERKLLAAVFRHALDKVSKAGWGQYMCNNLKRAAAELTDTGYMTGYAKVLAEKALEILEQYRPFEHTSCIWFDTDERGRGVRMAILNLCITELVRGGK